MIEISDMYRHMFLSITFWPGHIVSQCVTMWHNVPWAKIQSRLKKWWYIQKYRCTFYCKWDLGLVGSTWRENKILPKVTLSILKSADLTLKKCVILPIGKTKAFVLTHFTRQNTFFFQKKKNAQNQRAKLIFSKWAKIPLYNFGLFQQVFENLKLNKLAKEERRLDLEDRIWRLEFGKTQFPTFEAAIWRMNLKLVLLKGYLYHFFLGGGVGYRW